MGSRTNRRRGDSIAWAGKHRDPITLRVERANSLRSRSLIRVCTTVSLLYFLYLRACTRVAAALIGYVI